MSRYKLDERTNEWVPRTKPVTPGVLVAVIAAAVAFAIVMVLGELYLTRTSSLPVCEQEDGNLDGKPCVWIDPDTGLGFTVSSEAYRDPF